MTLEEFMKQYHTLRNIKRFSMESTIRPQDLCGHGYSVGTIFYILCNSTGIRISAETLFMIMNHDYVESYTGDLNKLLKEKNETTKGAWNVLEAQCVPDHLGHLTDVGLVEHFKKTYGDSAGAVENIFHLADALDAYLYCSEEVKLGNQFFRGALEHYDKKVTELFEALNSRAEVLQ